MGKVNTAQLSRKDIHIGIKNHMGINDFCKMYGVGENQFKDIIRQIFRDQADQILRKIAASGKKTKTAANRHKAPLSAPPPSDFSATTENAPNTDQSDPILIAAKPDTLASLTAETHDELAIISQLTSSNANLIGTYEQNLTRINTIRQELTKIQNEITEKTEELFQLFSANEQIQTTVAENATKRSEHADNVRKILKRINELKTINVFVYQDGNIEVASDEPIELDDSGHEDLYNQLVSNPEYDDLTIRDLRTLSRTICVVQNLGGMPVEVAFEVNGLEPFYTTLLTLIPSV